MPPCISPLSSFRQVMEIGHPFIPRHVDAVEGLHLPGARPIHPPDAGLPSHGSNTATDGGTLDDSGETNAQAAAAEVARADANAAAGAAQVQGPVQHGPIANPPPLANVNANVNANANANAPGIEAVIKEKISALVTAFRRLFPVMMVERWLRRAIRDQ